LPGEPSAGEKISSSAQRGEAGWRVEAGETAARVADISR